LIRHSPIPFLTRWLRMIIQMRGIGLQLTSVKSLQANFSKSYQRHLIFQNASVFGNAASMSALSASAMQEGC
jgi:hypothetical protein